MERDQRIVFSLVGGFCGYWGLRWLGVPFETMVSIVLAVAITLVIGWPIGRLLGGWLARSADVDAPGFRIVAWSNLVAWLLPPVGMTVSVLSKRLARESVHNEGHFEMLSVLGFVLTVGNAGLGAALVSQGLLASPPAPPAPIVATTTERSWPRCQFASIEHWSFEDVATYCDNNYQPTAEEMREFERLSAEYEAQQAAG